MTLQVFALVLIFQFLWVLSLPLLYKSAGNPSIIWLTFIFGWCEGLPCLLQLIFIYYVLPSIGIRLDRLPAAVIAFVLNYAAYFTEIFRGGIETIPKGQYEAAKVLKFESFWHSALYYFASGYKVSYRASLMKLWVWSEGYFIGLCPWDFRFDFG